MVCVRLSSPGLQKVKGHICDKSNMACYCTVGKTLVKYMCIVVDNVADHILYSLLDVLTL